MATSTAGNLKWILWLNTVAETIIAFGMFSMPAAFFPGAEGLSASIARAFSFAILVVAFISLSATGVNTSYDKLKNVVLILLVYHTLQLIAQIVNGAMYPPMLIPPVVIHTVLTTLFAFYYFRLNRTPADLR
ncbi:MAG: hypothetical protein JNL40_03775 [Cyclobacteriaceae bacterium]|nr:hypothetical protein [Cyclobacteriaceae bacterium]